MVTMPAQQQDEQPGTEAEMEPRPRSSMTDYRGSAKLAGKVAVISGGDSGIGRAVAVGFAKEGADVAILWLDEVEDAAETVTLIEAEGRKAMSIKGDVGDPSLCRAAVAEIVDQLGRIDILVNNAAEQHLAERFEDITDAQLERTFRTNIFGQFYLTRAALPLIPEGGVIINTTSVTAYQGNAQLIDYAATKAAIVGFTRSLAKAVLPRGIRVNAVAPGPNLDPADPGELSGRAGSPARREHSDGPAGTAGRGGPELHFSGVERLVLHDWSGAAPERRRHRQRLATPPGERINSKA